MLFSQAVFAGPQDVWHPVQAEPALRPHQKLQLPARRAQQPAPLPAPPAPHVSIGSGQIAISDNRSLLAQFGTMQPEQAGFRRDVWLYMSAQRANKLLSGLKVSPIEYLNERIISLLQLKAPAPEEAGARFFENRLEALTLLGKKEVADAMLLQVPENLLDELDAAQLFELLAPRLGAQAACDAVAVRPASKSAAAASWQRVQLFCRAQAGEFAAVEVAQSLAEERGAPLASWFVDLLEFMQYSAGSLPSLPDNASALDWAMIQAMRLSEGEAAAGVLQKPYPKKPAYALMGLARQVRAGKWNEADDWLAMLDRRAGDSAASFVAHELVHFLNTDGRKPRSSAANTLPPFAGADVANEADKISLARFYGVMERFGYEVPAVTRQWLASGAVGARWRRAPAPALMQAVRSGDVAGYLLNLDAWMRAYPLKSLDNETIGARLDELRRLHQPELARRLAAEAILQSMM